MFWRFAVFYVVIIAAISFAGISSPRESIHNPADLTVLLGTVILSSFALFMEYRKMKKNQAKEPEPQNVLINKRLTFIKKSQLAFLFLVLAHIISNSRQFTGAINNTQLEFSFLSIALDQNTFLILFAGEFVLIALAFYLFSKNETE